MFDTSALYNARLWDSAVPGVSLRKSKSKWRQTNLLASSKLFSRPESYLGCLVIIDIKSNLVNDKVSKQNWLPFVRALKWPLIQLNSGLILKSSVFRWLAWTQSKGTLYPPLLRHKLKTKQNTKRTWIAVGPNFVSEITWKLLILLVKNDQKIYFVTRSFQDRYNLHLGASAPQSLEFCQQLFWDTLYI